MKTNSLKSIKDTSTLCLSTLLLLGSFSACSDDKKDSTKKQQVSNTSTPKIEVVKNKNAHEIKVASKDNKRAKNSSYYYDYGEKSEYNQDAQPANAEASVRVRPRTKIDANMHVRSPYEEVQVSLLVNKLSKKFIVKCSACHNDYANGVIGPSLIGRDSDYIYKKIKAFKSGEKSNPLMKDLINMMNDKEIRDMANDIYKFNKQIKNMRNK